MGSNIHGLSSECQVYIYVMASFSFEYECVTMCTRIYG